MEMWGQTGRTPFLYATEPTEKLVNVPSVLRFSEKALGTPRWCEARPRISHPRLVNDEHAIWDTLRSRKPGSLRAGGPFSRPLIFS
jgi:hypothetical protein